MAETTSQLTTSVGDIIIPTDHNPIVVSGLPAWALPYPLGTQPPPGTDVILAIDGFGLSQNPYWYAAPTLVGTGARVLMWSPTGIMGAEEITGDIAIGGTGVTAITPGVIVAADLNASIFGTTAGTVCQGNDARLSDSRTANGGNADTLDTYHAASFALLAGSAFTGNVSLNKNTDNPTLSIDSAGGGNYYDPTILLQRTGSTIVAGKLWYDNSNGDLYLDNCYNNDAGITWFRCKTSGTPVNALKLTALAATFGVVVDATGFKAGGTAPAADGTYCTGLKLTPVTGTNGSITIKGGIVTAITAAT